MNRGLDYIFIRVQGQDGGWENLCLSDAEETQRVAFLEQLDRERLVFVANELARTLRMIGDQLNIKKEG